MKVPTSLAIRPHTSKSTNNPQQSFSTDSNMPQVKRTISQTFSRAGDLLIDRNSSRAGSTSNDTTSFRPQKERRIDPMETPTESEGSSTCRKLIRKASNATARSMRSRLSFSSHFKPTRQDTAAHDLAFESESTAPTVPPTIDEAEKPLHTLRDRVFKKRRGGASGPSGEEGHWNPPAAPVPASYVHPALNIDPLSGQSARASVAAYNNIKASDSATSLASRDDESAVYLQPCMSLDTVRKDFVSTLPAELCCEVFSHLEVESLARAEQVSRTWNRLASSQAVWQRIFRAKYEPKVHVSPAPIQMGGLGFGEVLPGQNWKQMTKARRTIERRWIGANPAASYFNGHTDSVYCCQFDEQKIITGSRDRTIRVWDIETKKCIKVIGGPASLPVKPTIPPLPTIPNHTVSDEPNLNGTEEGREIYHIPSDYHSQSILCLQYDEEFMVTGSSDTTCIVWDVVNFQPLFRLRRHTAGVLDVCLDANYIISCSKDATICVWHRRTGELYRVLYGHKGPVNAVQLRGNLLVSASGDGVAKLWDLDTGECIKEYPSRDGGLAAVEFSDDAKYVLAGGNNQVVYKFDASTGENLIQYQGHSGLVRSLFVDAPNNTVVSGSYDQSIRVYNYTSGACIGLYENWTTSWILSAKSDYRRIVCTSQDGRAVMLDFGHGVHGVDLLQSRFVEGV